jgi:predicted flap endonuclease-1-like 5' DNA nuclease/myosin heavy subunit
MESWMQILTPLLLLLVGGLLLPPLWRRFFGGAAATRLLNAERELADARSALTAHKEELSRLRAEFETVQATAQRRETALAELEPELAEARRLRDAQQTELAQVRTELAAWRQQEHAAEAAQVVAAAASASLAADLSAQLNEMQAALTRKEAELVTLLERIKQMAPLPLQLKERELRLRTLEAQFAEARTAHAAELAVLQNQLTELSEQTPQLKAMQDALRAGTERERDLHQQLLALSTQRETAAQIHTATLAERDRERATLRQQMQEAEDRAGLAADALSPELEAQLRDQTAAHRRLRGEKEAEIIRLRARLGELEQAQTRLSQAHAQAETQQAAALKDKDAAIALLQLRVRELEPLSSELAEHRQQRRALSEQLERARAELAAALQQLAAAHAALQTQWQTAQHEHQHILLQLHMREAELAELQTHLGQMETLPGQLAERSLRLEQLQHRLAELEPLAAQLYERDQRLRELEALTHRVISDKEEALSNLRWRVSELEALISQRDEALSQLRWRVAALEPLRAELAERDARLRRLTAEFQRASAAQEEELCKFRWRVSELESLSTPRAAGFTPLRQRQAESEPHAALAQTEMGHPVQAAPLLASKDAEIRTLRRRISELQTAAANSMVTSPVAPATLSEARRQMEQYRQTPPERYDDLKQIHGIGPALEKLLHQLGVYFWAQIAVWDEAEMDWVDAQLGRFKGRIRRANCVANARAVQSKTPDQSHWQAAG